MPMRHCSNRLESHFLARRPRSRFLRGDSPEKWTTSFRLEYFTKIRPPQTITTFSADRERIEVKMLPPQPAPRGGSCR
jgi:hypothetical protein